MEFETENVISFTLAPAKMKYLGINLTKYVWGLYEENHKALRKEIKEECEKATFCIIPTV